MERESRCDITDKRWLTKTSIGLGAMEIQALARASARSQEGRGGGRMHIHTDNELFALIQRSGVYLHEAVT